MNLRFAHRVLLALALLAPALIADARPVCACSTKIRTYATAMRSDLKNLSTAEEAYFSDFRQFTDHFPATQFSAAQGVTIEITHADSVSWAARATHAATPQKCSVAGKANPGPDDEYEPKCDLDPAEASARLVQRVSFALFLVSVAVGLVGLFTGRVRPWVLTTLVALCVINPYWLDPFAGPDCGSGTTVVTMSMAWVVLGGFLAFRSVTATPRQLV